MGRLYIANDVESAGGRLGIHSTLSFGAAVVIREKITFQEYWERGLVFYAELRPKFFAYEKESMVVGCSQLVCLEEIKQEDHRFDTASPKFSPMKVLELMERMCEVPMLAMRRFASWIEGFRNGEDKIIGVTDTVFFDGGRIDLLLSKHYQGKSPYGWSGLNLDSFFRGYMRNRHASLKTLRVLDERTKPHRADHDAIFLAQQAHVLLYEKMEG